VPASLITITTAGKFSVLGFHTSTLSPIPSVARLIQLLYTHNCTVQDSFRVAVVHPKKYE
jgi:hypothetical protein